MVDVSLRKLTPAERDLVDREIRSFINPVYLSPRHWEEIGECCVAESDGNLTGICGLTRLRHWVKLGPFVVFKKYQGQGIGKRLFEKAAGEKGNKNLFVGSRNPAVHKIAKNWGFVEIKNIWCLPWELQLYLAGTMKWVFDLAYLRELFRKGSVSEGSFRCFIKKRTA